MTTATATHIDRSELHTLTDQQARQLACNLAERLLPVYAGIFPHDNRLAEALTATRELIDLPPAIVAERLQHEAYRTLERRVLKAFHGAVKISKRNGRFLPMTIAMMAAGAVHDTFKADAHEAAYGVCTATMDAAGLQTRWEQDAQEIAADEIRAQIADLTDGIE